MVAFPVISEVNVAFWAEGSGQEGNYLFDGTILKKLADLNTPIPGGSGNFTIIGYPGISGSHVAFLGWGSSGQQGIYMASPQQGSVTVPSMTEWGMIILVILFGIASVYHLKRKRIAG